LAATEPIETRYIHGPLAIDYRPGIQQPMRGRSAVISLLRFLALAFALGLTMLVAAEITCRVDDRIRSGVPIFSVPDHSRDLVVHEGTVIHGRPNGRFQHWRL